VGQIRRDQRRLLQEQGIGVVGKCASAAALLCILLLVGCGDDSGSEETSEAFEPRVSIEAVGGTQRTDKPALVIRVAPGPGEARIRSAAITLPSAVLADQAALGNLCSESELEDDRCAGRQRMGTARAVSPAYDAPLTGPVYAVSGSGGLPRPAYVLSGGGAELLLRGDINVVGQRIQATVEDVPDIPLDAFRLTLDGGEPGYLVLSRDICRAPAVADVTLTSQAGETVERRAPLEADCG
jgi:hypothetical protein